MSDIIFLSDVRLSFPNITEPQKNKQYPDKPPVYNSEFIMPPTHAGFQQFGQRYSAMAADKWKAHANQIMQIIQNDRKLRCFGPGTEKVNQKTLKMYDGYEGMVFITASNKNAPQMIKPDGQAVDPTNTMEYQAFARKLYGGCRVNAAVKPWLQENTHGRGIRCDFVAIQFLRDDTPFGEGTPDATGLFGAVAAAPAAAPAGAMPGFFGATPAAAPAMPAPPTFGAPASMPSFFGS